MLEVCFLHRALDDWEIKKSSCFPTEGNSYLQNYHLERQHEKYRCCLHWKTVFLAKIIMGDGNSLQICSPLLLISACTVNKRHYSQLIRAACYLLTRWHNLVRMFFNLKFKKGKKKRQSKTYHENMPRVLHIATWKQLSVESQQKKTISSVVSVAELFQENNYSSCECWHFYKQW